MAGFFQLALVKSCPAGNLPFADLTQATTYIDFAPCTIIILPCLAASKSVREARAVAELRSILQQEASLLDKRGLSVWRIRQDALTVIGKMSLLGFRLAEFGVNAVDGVHTWNLVCTDDSIPPGLAANAVTSATASATRYQPQQQTVHHSSPPQQQQQQQQQHSSSSLNFTAPHPPTTNNQLGGNTIEGNGIATNSGMFSSNIEDHGNNGSGSRSVMPTSNTSYEMEASSDFKLENEIIRPQSQNAQLLNSYNFLSTSYSDNNNTAGSSNNQQQSRRNTQPNSNINIYSRFNTIQGSSNPRSTRTAAQAAAGMNTAEQGAGNSTANSSSSGSLIADPSSNNNNTMQYDNSNRSFSRRSGAGAAPTMLSQHHAPVSTLRLHKQTPPSMAPPAAGTSSGGGIISNAGLTRRMSTSSSSMPPTMAPQAASSSHHHQQQASTSSSSHALKKSSKKRKKKGLSMSRSKSRKRVPSNFGPLHPRTAALLETRRTFLVPDELKALQSNELIPLLERVQAFLSVNPQLGLRPRWRLLQPIGHPHCTAHFKCTTHVKGSSVMCPARIAVGLDRITRRYHITYEMISHECQQQLLGAAAAGSGSIIDYSGAAVAASVAALSAQHAAAAAAANDAQLSSSNFADEEGEDTFDNSGADEMQQQQAHGFGGEGGGDDGAEEEDEDDEMLGDQQHNADAGVAEDADDDDAGAHRESSPPMPTGGGGGAAVTATEQSDLMGVMPEVVPKSEESDVAHHQSNEQEQGEQQQNWQPVAAAAGLSGVSGIDGAQKNLFCSHQVWYHSMQNGLTRNLL